MRKNKLSYLYILAVISIGIVMPNITKAQENKPITSVTQPTAPTVTLDYPPAYITGSLVNYVRTWEAIGPLSDPTTFRTQPYSAVKQTTAYLDALGRPLQTVIKEITPGTSPKDMVSPVFFDALGRETHKYMGYISTGSDGNIKMDPFNEEKTFLQTQYSGEQVFYSKTDFESSPLNRPLKIYAQGNSWAGNNIGIEQQYLFNIAADDVKKWDVGFDPVFENNIPSVSGIYDEGTLFKNVSLDENGNATVEYKDKDGKVILKKVQAGTVPTDFGGYDNWLCTYYVYDDLQQLRFVIPPNAVSELKKSAVNWVLASGVINGLCFRYEYDYRNRLVAKKVPDAGWVYMIYDKTDRLVFTQDANMRPKGWWLASLYDGLNRPVLTGMMTYGSLPNTQTTWTELQNAVTNNPAASNSIPVTITTILPNPIDINLNTLQSNIHHYTAAKSITLDAGFSSDNSTDFIADISPTTESGTGETLTVGNNPIPIGSPLIPLTITYYDDYNFNVGSGKNYSTVNNSKLDEVPSANCNLYPVLLPSVADQATVQTAGMITGKRVRILSDPNDLSAGTWLTTVNFYDNRGRAIQTYSDNHKFGTDVLTTRYDFTGKSIGSYLVVNEPVNANTLLQSTSIKTRMEYDHAGRLMEIYKAVNDGTDKLIAKNEYDEMGQLKKKDLGIAPLESLEYTYNVRGWLKGINQDYANNQVQNSQSLAHYFGMELNYDWGFTNNQLNGNIAGTKWRSAGDGEQRAFGFGYDKLSRIMFGDFSQGSTYLDDAAVKFDMKMGDDGIDYTSAYDDNGNIQKMQQYGLKLNSSSPIDDLKYNYAPTSNKLLQVTDDANDKDSKLGDFKYDPSTKDVTDYGYDNNGNLTSDNNKNISSIVYNFLNLPQVITFNVSNYVRTITYTYDAVGNKLKKETVEMELNDHLPGTKTTTDYVNGLVYETKVLTSAPPLGGEVVSPASYYDVLQFISMEEGRIRFKPAVDAIPADFVYDYFIKDHLGNTRAVLTEEHKVDLYPAATMELAPSTIEESLYAGLPETRVDLPTGYPNDNTTNPNVKVARTSGGANPGDHKIGPSITLKVMAGDEFVIRASSWYKTNGSNIEQPVNPLPELLNSLISGISGVSASVHGTVTATQLENTGVLTPGVNQFLFSRSYDDQRPKAYLNWIFFDEQFNYVESGSGFDQVPAESAFGTVPNQMVHTHTPSSFTAAKNGYLYVYVSNETPNIDVFFDNLQVTHTRGPLLEETHYYPFGLTMAGISSKAAGKLENKRRYNAGTELQSKEFSDGSGLELYATNFRSLDPQIGRFWQVDPMADAMLEQSPYAYANNNPLTFNDPLGLLSDSLHPVNLSEVVVKSERKVSNDFLPYIKFPNQKPGTIASNKDWPFSFSKDRRNDLVDSWALGLGATNRIYLPNHPMTKRLKDAYQVNRARNYFYKKYLTDYKNGLSLKGASVTEFKGSFGLSGIVSAGFDVVEQFVGSMDIDIQVDEKGENLLFIVTNNTSATSALYHMADSHERTPGNEARGNMYQVFIWKEPITSEGFSTSIYPNGSIMQYYRELK